MDTVGSHEDFEEEVRHLIRVIQVGNNGGELQDQAGLATNSVLGYGRLKQAGMFCDLLNALRDALDGSFTRALHVCMLGINSAVVLVDCSEQIEKMVDPFSEWTRIEDVVHPWRHISRICSCPVRDGAGGLSRWRQADDGKRPNDPKLKPNVDATETDAAEERQSFSQVVPPPAVPSRLRAVRKLLSNYHRTRQLRNHLAMVPSDSSGGSVKRRNPR